MQYTEEHYAKLYNELPEGLKDLVLSGRLAILVSAIGSRHGLSADQIADLEPAIEDVCLGLITQEELVDNILKNVHIDQRVANRIAAEAELEILKPFTAELIIARKQKEDLDRDIMKTASPKKASGGQGGNGKTGGIYEPKDLSEHPNTPSTASKISEPAQKATDYFTQNGKGGTQDIKEFDWEKDFVKKKEEPAAAPQTSNAIPASIENKLNQLTETINKLVDAKFGTNDKKDSGVSEQMQELLKRLEKAEKENEENKKLIKSLQTEGNAGKPLQNIFGTPEVKKDETKIQIDKQRKVDIDHTEPKKAEPASGNIQIQAVSKPIPIVSSSVSKDTLDSIVELRNREEKGTNPVNQASSKKTLSLDELIKGDDKIKTGLDATAPKSSLTFPGLNEEKKIEIKDATQKGNLRQILLDDIEFLKNLKPDAKKEEGKDGGSGETTPDSPITKEEPIKPEEITPRVNATQDVGHTTPTYDNNPFKEELIPKTKEERMKALQDKIKALNKGVSVGGKTNISASGLDPYKI